MGPDWEKITHITKLDPAEDLPSDLEPLEETDLIIVGGSDGVTQSNVQSTIQRVLTCFPDKPIFQEPYNSSHISLEIAKMVDFFSIPVVYNGDYTHCVGKHIDQFADVSTTLEEFPRPLIEGNVSVAQNSEIVSKIAAKILGEGYVIQHVESTAGTVAGVDSQYSTEQVAGAALATETLYKFPIFYLEYSGEYGGPKDVSAAAPYLNETALLYGGGIERSEQTKEILAAGADAVVVGNCFYDSPSRYLQTIP